MLWILVVIVVVAGIVTVPRGQVRFGNALIFVGLLVGPGGARIFA